MCPSGAIFADMKRGLAGWLVGVGMCLIFLGCGPERIYEQGYPLAGNVWKADTALLFDVAIDNPLAAQDIFYRVRYDLDYPYYNLYVHVQVKDSLGKALYTGQHELVLLDPQTGKPAGSGLGGVYEKEFTALAGVRFPAKGVYRVRIAQYMRQATLPGLHEFGIRVSPHL
jgi:gliding motility-associated lipoprotein GldH